MRPRGGGARERPSPGKKPMKTVRKTLDKYLAD